jgi:hypothetical protein
MDGGDRKLDSLNRILKDAFLRYLLSSFLMRDLSLFFKDQEITWIVYLHYRFSKSEKSEDAPVSNLYDTWATKIMCYKFTDAHIVFWK